MEQISTMNRRPTTQDISWLLDLERNKQLNLDPPYQRRSVWTPKDKQFFLDTIFRDYPSPAIYLHKTISADGKTMYHVVDGKQRIQTILEFSKGKVRISKEFGDARLNGKKWADLEGEQELRLRFWNYQVPVEMVDVVDGSVVNEVFDRLNRNSRKLTSQELRHAKFDGWFIHFAEAECDKEEWRKLGIVTTGRAKRMNDAQFLAELMLIVLDNKIRGFDQEDLDEAHGHYDDTEDLPNFSEAEFLEHFEGAKAFIMSMNNAGAVTEHAKSLTHFYTLWAVVALHRSELPEASLAEERYKTFMTRVEKVIAAEDLAKLVAEEEQEFRNERKYVDNATGASTDLKQREARYEVLKGKLLGA